MFFFDIAELLGKKRADCNRGGCGELTARGSRRILDGMASLAIEVPDELNERLEKRANAAGMTVSEYLADLAKKMAVLPTREEMIERLATLTRADIAASADAVREGREERDDQLDRAVSGQ